MRQFSIVAAVMLLLASGQALANDSVAELETGGLVLVRSDVVAMESEDLFISLDEIRVDYVFRNRSDRDVASIVAFPMPVIDAHPYEEVALPWFDDGRDVGDNLFGFTVTVDGGSIEPELEKRALTFGIDVTDDLAAAGVPVNQRAAGIGDSIERLTQRVKDDWVSRGLLYVMEYEDGGRIVREYSPIWSMRMTYWWRMGFPAGRDVRVSHRYAPSVGGTAGATFLDQHGMPHRGEWFNDYERRYCMDEPFLRALRNATEQAGLGYPPFFENRISYILTTGGNWAGPIGDFRLTVDKGSTTSFVSFCGEGVTKTGPTTFEMRKRDFMPERELEILIMRRFDGN